MFQQNPEVLDQEECLPNNVVYKSERVFLLFHYLFKQIYLFNKVYLFVECKEIIPVFQHYACLTAR